MVLKNGDELMPAHERKPARDAPRVPGEPSITSLVWLHLQSRFKAPKRSGAEWCRSVRLFSRSNEGGVGTRATRRGEGSREPCAAHVGNESIFLRFAHCLPRCAPAPRLHAITSLLTATACTARPRPTTLGNSALPWRNLSPLDDNCRIGLHPQRA